VTTRRLLAYSMSPHDRSPYLYREDYAPEIKVAFIPGLRYTAMFAVQMHGLKSIAQLHGHCPIRNKGLRSFFRTSRGVCGPTILRANITDVLRMRRRERD
jgi:hypothetical protein